MKVKQVISTILVIVVLCCTLDLVPTTSVVYASGIQDMAKGNEQNFAAGDFTGIPNFIILKIECGPDNKLSVTMMKEDDYGTSDDGSWEAVGEVYFDDKKMGVFDLHNPTSTKGGGIEYQDGSSTYLLPWQITAPVTVKAILTATNTYPYNGGICTKHTSQTVRFEAEQVESPINIANLPLYLPLLLGLAGLIIVVCVGYQRYGTRIFHITRLFHLKEHRI